MKFIGTFQARKVFWFDFGQFQLDELPQKDWICFAISETEPDVHNLERFIRYSIDKGILEFKSFGQYGEKLHDVFDETMTQMEVYEHHIPIAISTTWHSDKTLDEAFWECFFATCLPVTADLDSISIVCIDMDGTNRSKELKEIIDRFENGGIAGSNE